MRPSPLALFLALTIPSLATANGGGHDGNDGGGDLRVGTCKKEITPISPGLTGAYQAAFGSAGVPNHTDPVFMAGFGNNRQATAYNDKLWARGVVIDRKGKRVAIVSIDVIGYFKNEIDTIRGLVSPDSKVDFVLVSSTHQHEGPDTIGLWGADELSSGIDYAYLDYVNARVADCIDHAASHLEKARVYYATANSEGLSLGTDPEDDGFGVSDGKVLAGDAALAPATQGRIVDPNIAIMQLTERNGHDLDVLATLVNFGSHPESMGSNNTRITSDFPHYVRERIEDEYGGLAIWMAGDLGVLQGPLDIDVQDPVTNLPAPRRTFRFAEVHGTQIAERAIEAIDAVRLKKGKPNPSNGDTSPKIDHATVNPVSIQLDNPYFRFFFAIGVIDVRRTLYTNGVPDASIGFPYPPPFDGIPLALGEDLQTEVSAVRIGDGAIAVVPTELDPQIGFGYREQLEDATGADHTFIAGLGNDEIGYQVPFAKWDDSCHACAPFILGGVPQFCPLYPNIDCNTVFQNNVGQQVDPSVSEAFDQAVDDL
ncbi:MAG TPA: hypothetical protein VII72_22620 [Myxococcota bacterium]|jgi:hypothetical protein